MYEGSWSLWLPCRTSSLYRRSILTLRGSTLRSSTPRFAGRRLSVLPSTHQLYPERYAHDCFKHAKRFIDQYETSFRCSVLGEKLMVSSHSDANVEEAQLSNSFDNTRRAWEVRQGYI